MSTWLDVRRDEGSLNARPYSGNILTLPRLSLLFRSVI
jgi:hypothetical protein